MIVYYVILPIISVSFYMIFVEKSICSNWISCPINFVLGYRLKTAKKTKRTIKDQCYQTTNILRNHEPGGSGEKFLHPNVGTALVVFNIAVGGVANGFVEIGDAALGV